MNQTPQPSAGRGLRWPIMIVSLLGLNVSICAITVVSAIRNPAQIEPDYYQQSLKWDEQRAAASTTASPKDD